MQNLKALLNTLEGMKSYRPRKALTKIEAILDRISKYGIMAATVPFSVLIALALWHKFISKLSDGWVDVAIWSAGLSQLVAGLSLLCPPVVMVCSIWMWKERSRILRDAEIDHDQNFAAQLRGYDVKHLKRAKHHLELKIRRLERRLGYFIEADGKKFAAFSLLILNFTVGNMLLQGNWSSLFSTSLDSPISTQIVTILMGFVFAISISAMCVRFITNRDTYRIELIELSLASRDLG
ncbi:hypothetical protein ALO95_200291 [Pseudomonas syringae pv. antirrhini]|uniref:Iron--sulfur cluster insertion protein ErpA n=1 Tax=Pseudomonas syringae pv. antirrhini TaxID=251702 RepID=A0A0P9NTE5_9PSED|nr:MULTISPECIES: hypothetical protein [Pseudomonas]KPW47360.1 hypothetical protein ALO88_200022 [Pseudomonas syringae pv. antirrhini]RMP34211.1 hypothetical protein ALQ23_200151 [Pseudomonas syringae pv. antirrhini]RMW26147.1 hypothetical protein ALO95_200291 [Pseudomonas syringae pv. antirrhini]WIN06906.1 hypothetical protein QQF68_25610 [Pseudomonas syringae pv. antirrhini str. 126]